MTRDKIYKRELDRLLEEGEQYHRACFIAAEIADEIYWRMVDEGWEQAKERAAEAKYDLKREGG